MQLLKHLAKKGHQYNQFSTGNSETLQKGPDADGINMRELLYSFLYDI